MKLDRPHIVARKSAIPYLKWYHFILLLISLVVVNTESIIGLLNLDIASFTGEWWFIVICVVVIVVTLVLWIKLILVIINAKHNYYEFYDGYVIHKEGWFRKQETKFILPKVHTCHVYRTFEGRIFSYGDVLITPAGGKKWSIELRAIRKPLAVKKYIDNRFFSAKEVKSMRINVLENQGANADLSKFEAIKTERTLERWSRDLYQEKESPFD